MTTSEGFRYVLTIIDRYTNLPEAIPLKKFTTKNVAKSLYEGWICRFVCPDCRTTDQGRQFERELLRE